MVVMADIFRILNHPSILEIKTTFRSPIPELLEKVLAFEPDFLDSEYIKIVNTPSYNYIFNGCSGTFARCGRTLEIDPQFSPLGPEIADIEISTICSGPTGIPCSWCYKSNSPSGHNMSFTTFQQIFAKLPENLTQIAFGIGDLDGNPELAQILSWCRKNLQKRMVVPNITINGAKLSDTWVDILSHECGAVAVSRYLPKELCYNAVNRLSQRLGLPDVTLRQVNIHQLLSEETYNSCLELLQDIKSDPRLQRLNAVVFLGLKPKGLRNQFHSLLDLHKLSYLVKFAIKHQIRIGFDSCSANNVLNLIAAEPKLAQMSDLIEPCESMGFSVYINSNGVIYPCSFLEGESGYTGIDLLQSVDFLTEIWFGPMAHHFREQLIQMNRACPRFQLEMLR
jgi:sulfatase maturation enzyme AslB (radical SAM superfamily)